MDTSFIWVPAPNCLPAAVLVLGGAPAPARP